MKILGFIALACALPSLGFAQGGPAIEDVDIRNLSIRGTGCPKGTVESIVTTSEPGKETADYFQFAFDAFVVNSGPDVEPSKNRAVCNLTFDIKYPKGYRFHFENIEYDGYAVLESRKIYAELFSVLSFPFQKELTSKLELLGPYNNEFKNHQTTQILEEFKTDCSGDAVVEIESMIQIKGDVEGTEGEVGVDQGSGKMKQSYSLVWEKC